MPYKKSTLIAHIQADWAHPTEIRFGAGRMKELPDICRKLNIHTPLLVTDPGVVKLPFLKRALILNRNEGLETHVFSEITLNPNTECVKQGAQTFRKGQCDGIIAVGGGSALDAGKAIALAAAVGYHDLWKYIWDSHNIFTPSSDFPPIIAIPTTAGTGSEVNANAVISDEVKHLKKSLYHPKLLPGIVIADPALTQSLPSALTAATGMDALSHNLEALCSPVFNPMLDAIAFQEIGHIKTWLPLAAQEGRNLEARLYMMVASISGAVASEKGLGAMHALAHALGAMFQIHHGIIIATIMPYVLTFNRKQIEEKIRRLAHILDLSLRDFDTVLSWILGLRQQFEIPHSLGELGVKTEHIPVLTEKALQDGNASTNPIPLTQEKIENLLRRIIEGEL